MNDLLQYNFDTSNFQYIMTNYKNTQVLFSNQVSDLLQMPSPTHISANFNRNQSFFIKDVDYFYLDGEELQDFKECIKNIHGTSEFPSELKASFIKKFLFNALRTGDLYLWTESGVLNHIKLAKTERSKDLFLVVRDAYLKLKYAKQNQNMITMNNIEEYFNNKFNLILESNDNLNNRIDLLSNKLDSSFDTLDDNIRNKFEQLFTFFGNKFGEIYNGCKWIYSAIKSPIVTKEHTVTNKTITSTPQVDSNFGTECLLSERLPDMDVVAYDTSLRKKGICPPCEYVYADDNFEEIIEREDLISINDYVDMYVPRGPGIRKTRVYRDYLLQFLVSAGALDKLTLRPLLKFENHFKYFIHVKFNSKSVTRTATRIYLTDEGIKYLNNLLIEHGHSIKN